VKLSFCAVHWSSDGFCLCVIGFLEMVVCLLALVHVGCVNPNTLFLLESLIECVWPCLADLWLILGLT